VKPRAEPVRKRRESRKTYEDTMFFTRLRKRAKWIFAALAAAFALGFLAFGVGTGVQGGNIGDVLRDFFGGGDATTLDEARADAEQNPNDVEKQLVYARALQSASQTDAAAEVYERVTAIDPDNSDALRSLASIYGREAAVLAQQAGIVRFAAQDTVPNQTLFDPNASDLQRALAEDPFAFGLAAGAEAEADRLQEQAAAAAARQQSVLERIVALDPEDPTLQLSLGNAAQLAGDDDAALAAYERALELEPDSGRSPQIVSLIQQLGGEVPPDVLAAAGVTAETETSATATAPAESTPTADDATATGGTTAP
jgi:tetratricopeptide (TPR) repeat protein